MGWTARGEGPVSTQSKSESGTCRELVNIHMA